PLSLRATMTNPGRGPVSDIAFSPSGTTLAATDNAHAAASSQNAATMWNTATGSEIGSFPYAGLGNGVAFSPDGGTLAIAGADLYVWNVASHANIAYLPSVSPQSVAFGRDGSTLAVGGRRNSTSSEEVGVLNVATRQWTATLPGLTRNSYVSALAFAPDGRTLAASDSANGVLYVWNVAGRNLLTTPVPLTASTGPLAFSPDSGTLAVSDGGTGGVRLWDVPSRAWGTTLTGPQSKGVRGIAFSPDGKTLAVADANGTVDLWDTASGKLTATQQVNAKGADAIAFSPDGKTLATGDGSGQIKLWAVSGH
ncbi:MAG: PD40 domain-containing protein, partial [Actinobacteria bacterium]|nr:PD40 domain-containing protein [Actinomycetota bacterium]